METAGLIRVPIFPLAGALLFPRSQLPLHIFEPRYRSMVSDALSGEKLIAMVQPKDSREPPAVFDIGCLGRIIASEALPNGRFNIVLEGLSRIRIKHEADVKTPYRQVDADQSEFEEDTVEPTLDMTHRAEVEREARRFAKALGYVIDWSSVSRLDDEMLVNGIAQVMPLDVGAKQALLEADTIAARADLLVQFMQFQRMLPGGADGPETLQ